TKITEAGIATFQDCPALNSLNLTALPVRGATLDLFKGRKLTGLHLYGTPIGDDDILSITQFPDLARLDLGATQITDAGLSQLTVLSKLTTLKLRKTRVTAAAVKKLTTALPKCNLEL